MTWEFAAALGTWTWNSRKSLPQVPQLPKSETVTLLLMDCHLAPKTLACLQEGRPKARRDLSFANTPF